MVLAHKPKAGALITHDVGDDLVWDKLAVPVPIFAVLFTTSLTVPHLSMEEKYDKESEVEVRDGGVEPCW